MIAHKGMLAQGKEEGGNCMHSVYERQIVATRSKEGESTHQVFIGSFIQKEIGSLLSEIGQQTAVGHKWHYNVGGRASINTDTNEPQNMGMFKLFHLHTLCHDLHNLLLVIKPYKKCIEYIQPNNLLIINN